MARLPKVQVTLRQYTVRPKDWTRDEEHQLPEGWEPVAGEFTEDGGLRLVLAQVHQVEERVVQTKIVPGPTDRKLVDAVGTELRDDVHRGKHSTT